MPEGFGTAGANTALAAVAAAYPWVQPHVGAPGAAGTANQATETTRKQATWGAAADGSLSNSADLQWTNVAGSEDYTHFSAWSAESGGSFGFSGTITAPAVVAGNTFKILAGDLDASVSLAS